MKSVKRSDFASLVKYLTDEQSKHERVGQVAVSNCHSDQADIASIEVLNTQAQNRRATSDKTYHLLVSFRAGEQPDDATLRAIEARICDGLGFGEHQRVSAAHHDTDNLHLHIAISKIHPTRYTIHDPYQDHKTLGQLCEKLEHDYGLAQDNHQARKVRAENRADDMERHAGVESLLGWIKRECQAQIQGAQSWAELHRVMQAHGLELRAHGNGLVIAAGDGTAVKASSVAREYSKTKLETRFGAFEPAPSRQTGEQPAKRYEKKPMRSRINTVELHARYKHEQQAGNTARTVEWTNAIARKTRLIEAAKRNGRLKRAAIKLIKGRGVGKKLLYATTSKTLRNEIQTINAQYLKERQLIYDKYQRLTWADWLRAKATDGDQEALRALRAREAAQGLKGNTVAGQRRDTSANGHAAQDSITKKGTIIYRFGTTAVRDDGDRLNVSRGANHDGLQAALRLAIERYGDRLTVNGTAAFKDQIAHAAATAKLSITFDDADLERRRQQLLLPITQENTHEHHRSRPDRGRTDRRRPATTRHAVAGIHHARPNIRGLPGKSGVSRIGRNPPPQSQNRLRGLSQLGVVQFSGRSEVLLPSHVPHHLEHQRAKPDNGVRRDIFGARAVTAGFVAADKYIAERDATRLKVFDIPKHTRYTHSNDAAIAFAGVRQIEGQALALLKRGDEITVLPIDDATARRLKRVAVGEAVTVTPKGAINSRGRSR